MNARSSRWAVLIVCGALWLGCPAPGKAQLCLGELDCDDDDFCTTDRCTLGVCFHGLTCDDGDQCTVDGCNRDAEMCINLPREEERCEDFNIFTQNERCHLECDGSLRCYDTLDLAVPCQCSLQCPAGFVCFNGTCVPSHTATPVPVQTSTRTPTRTPRVAPTQTPKVTLTPTPDLRVAVEIQDLRVTEGDTDLDVAFLIVLSEALDQPVTFGLSVSAGTATQGVDYTVLAGNGVFVTNTSATITFGTVTIPPNTTAAGNLAVRIRGDDLVEPEETFFVSLTVPPNLRGADASAMGSIVNDDSIEFSGGRVGTAGLTPQHSTTRVGLLVPLTLTWTHPESWRDLDSVDLRLRDQDEIALWLRFDEADNTFALIDPADGSAGAGVPPGSPAELSSGPVSLVVSESARGASGPDAPSVDLTFALRFAPAASDIIYLVEAAARDDAGAEQAFEAVGAIAVAEPLSCPGDCGEDGSVTIDELLLGVRIVLGTSSLSACPAFDLRPDGSVEIAELIASVGAALQGCAG